MSGLELVSHQESTSHPDEDGDSCLERACFFSGRTGGGRGPRITSLFFDVGDCLEEFPGADEEDEDEEESEEDESESEEEDDPEEDESTLRAAAFGFGLGFGEGKGLGPSFMPLQLAPGQVGKGCRGPDLSEVVGPSGRDALETVLIRDSTPLGGGVALRKKGMFEPASPLRRTEPRQNSENGDLSTGSNAFQAAACDPWLEADTGDFLGD